MADEKQTAPAAEKAKTNEPPTYHVDRLIAEAWERFGHASHVAAGAFAAERKKHFTLDEAEQVIESWLRKPVEVDPATAATGKEG